MSKYADTDVHVCFVLHNLTWSEVIKKKLDEEGVEFVEDLNILNASFVKDLFSGDKPIIRTRAETI